MEYKVIVNGNTEKWYHNGDLRKFISYYGNGQKEFEEYWLKGKRHREKGQPARISWYDNGQKKLEEYWMNGKWHREKGQTAVIFWYENGQKAYDAYYKNGKRHREGGQPAIISWYKNGQKEYEEYWLNDKKVSKEDTLKSSKTINIGGKEVSEETILQALKNYFK